MKTTRKHTVERAKRRISQRFLSLFSALLFVALWSNAAGQQADAPREKQPGVAEPNTAAPTTAPDAKTADKPAAEQQDNPTPAEGRPAPVPATAAANPAGEGEVRLNFRGVPLEMVLNHLSDAAGFIINIKPGTDIKGKVDVWSAQPLSKDEAVDLLNTVLNQNGYAAVRKERTLTIMSRKDAKTEDIPVRRGNEPKDIQKNDEMVTQIVPVRYANATQLTKDLQPLLPGGAEMTANESANALVITDTQASIRRMTEIVQALDTSISSISAVRVFPLKYADAKDLATAVKEVFQNPNQQNNN